MKKLLFIAVTAMVTLTTTNVNAQLLKKLKDKVNQATTGNSSSSFGSFSEQFAKKKYKAEATSKEENYEKANKLYNKLQKTFSHNVFFDADNTFHFINSENKVVITGNYTLDKDKLKFTSQDLNIDGILSTKFKDQGVVFYNFKYEGTDVTLRLYPYQKTEVELLGHNAGKNSKATFTSPCTKKYFL